MNNPYTTAAVTPPAISGPRRIESLQANENKLLAQRQRAGDDGARKRLIEGNQLLVMREARRYMHGVFMLEDLVAEGMIGLIRAIDKFDPEREVALSTYAVPWIRYQIERFIMKNRTGVEAPESMLKQITKVSKAKSRLTQVFGRDPSVHELASELEMTVGQVGAISDLANCTQSDWDPVREASIADSMADEHDLVEQVECDEMVEALGAAFETLPELERDLIMGRYGLGAAAIATHDELAKRHGLTVRQIRLRVDRAMDMLKQHFEVA